MLTRLTTKFTPLTREAARAFASGSPWGKVTPAPADPILGVNEAFKNDSRPNKQLLGVGAFRDNNGKPYILPCVTRAEEIIL